jgi:hypothetical protein
VIRAFDFIEYLCILSAMLTDSCQTLLASLWSDYTANTVQAVQIHHLLKARGEVIINDHIALRSIADVGAQAGVGMHALARAFEREGYVIKDAYQFADKHLRAHYWQHQDPKVPKVFISELIVDELSLTAQSIIAGLLEQLPANFATRTDLPWAGRPWQVSHATYLALLEESEYAAWVAAFGFRVNHFTVDANRLTTFTGLSPLNEFLQSHGFVLNAAGGIIKGTPTELLEQSSTMASAIDVTFSDGTHQIPSCYYEFAKRYPLPSGELFQGFVPASADRIFESTNRR